MESSHPHRDTAGQKAGPDFTREMAQKEGAESPAREADHDSILVRRSTEGDESAFVEIIDRYHGRVFSVANRFLRNAADAEEIAQDTFIRAYRGLASFRGDSSLSTWLYRIALNLTHNRYWYFFRRRRHDSLSLDRPMGPDSNTTLGDCIATENQGPEDEAVTSEFSDLIARCIETLDAPHREILVMRAILDLPYEEIARTLSLEIGTVKSRLGRARENLRQAIIQAAPDFGPASQPSDFLIHRRAAYS